MKFISEILSIDYNRCVHGAGGNPASSLAHENLNGKKTRPTFSYGGAGVSPVLCIACEDPLRRASINIAESL